MTTERIRWQDNGHGGLTGRVGTLDLWLFQISDSGESKEPWMLSAPGIPGLFGSAWYGTYPGELKGEAEKLLAAFVAALGAVFPDAEPTPRTPTPSRYDPQGQPGVFHLRPPAGSHELPCCGEPVLRVPAWHLLTKDPQKVTCTGKSSTEGSKR